MESPEGAAIASYSYNSSTGGDGNRGRGGGGGDCQQHVAAAAAAAFARRRRRTKRLRHPDPSGPGTPEGAAEDEEEVDYSSSPGTATEEEEDTAHCLILLSQGGCRRVGIPEEKFVSRRFAETTTTAGGKAGYYVYECKTCNKCFPSFQALGGHRASHKKLKLADDHDDVVGTASFARPPGHALGNKFRVHECSICGLEFASGQALGGHMRRHRPVGPATSALPGPPAVEEAVTKEKSVLTLDLNLPAPPEESGSGNSMSVVFGFSDQRPVALVDCHY